MLTKKTQYAIKALSYLAANYARGPVLISEISKEKHIPLKFLESILLELKQANILGSKKGKGGGYFIREDPAAVNLATVIRHIDGPIAMLPCVSLNFFQQCDDCDQTNCKINRVFAEARDAILSVLESKTLGDLG